MRSPAIFTCRRMGVAMPMMIVREIAKKNTTAVSMACPFLNDDGDFLFMGGLYHPLRMIVEWNCLVFVIAPLLPWTVRSILTPSDVVVESSVNIRLVTVASELVSGP